MKKIDARLLIAGGGTGGHVMAGIAIADEWMAQHHPVKLSSHSAPPSTVLFVGAQGGIEQRLIPQAGYRLQLLKIGPLNQVSFKRKLLTLLQLPFAIGNALIMLYRFQPHYVLGVGGYAAGPVLLCAWLLNGLHMSRIKISILEQNVIPGLTNRILSQLVNLIFITFSETKTTFQNILGKSKISIIFTGNPIRISIRPMPSAKRNPFTLLIFGGSQGSTGINNLVLSALDDLKSLKNQIYFIHQTGEKDYQRVVNAYKHIGIHGEIEKFIDDMPAAYAKASLLICRSGSSTLSEIAAIGRAAILIPLPTATNQHQTLNAQSFAQKGAAELLLQNETSGKALAKHIQNFIQDPSRILKIENQVKKFSHPHAAQKIVHCLITE